MNSLIGCTGGDSGELMQPLPALQLYDYVVSTEGGPGNPHRTGVTQNFMGSRASRSLLSFTIPVSPSASNASDAFVCLKPRSAPFVHHACVAHRKVLPWQIFRHIRYPRRSGRSQIRAIGRHTVRRNAFRDGSTNTRADAEPPSRSHLRSDNHPEPNQRADRNGDQHRDWNPERKAAATISINGSISSYVGARPSPGPAQVGSGRAGCPVALRDIPAPDFSQCRNEPIDLLIRM